MKRFFIKLAEIVQDSQHALKTVGWREAAKFFVQQVGWLPYIRAEYHVFARSLDNLDDPPEPKVPVVLRQGTPQDLDKLREAIPPSFHTRYQRLFASNGRFCFIAVHEDKIAACCWASTELDPDLERFQFQTGPQEIYVHNTYTAVEYRRLGIQSALITCRNRWLRDQGYKRIIALIRADNAASLTMVRKLGYYSVGHLTHRRILWWDRFYQTRTDT